VSFSNEEGTFEFAGKHARCTKMEIDTGNDQECVPVLFGGGWVEKYKPRQDAIITLEFRVPPTEMSIFTARSDMRQIRYKRVEDCTVQELLFAVRTKLGA
jgi:hypothetical protein